MDKGSPSVPSRPGGGGGVPRDRRATHRAAIEIPAALFVGTREIACAIRDLSTQGISLRLKESVAPGMVVRVGFRLPNSRQPLELAGVLVRISGGRQATTVGLQFVDPDAESLRVIETFVERNRSDRPFSERRAAGARDSRVRASRRTAPDAAGKGGKRGGLLSRWFRRRG